MLSLVPKDKVGRAWPYVSADLEKLLEGPIKLWTPESILEALEADLMQLWLAPRGGFVGGFIITELRVYPCLKILHMILASGRHLLHTAPEVLEVLENFAKSQGAGLIELSGRPGWKREFEKYNYTQEFVTLVKRI